MVQVGVIGSYGDLEIKKEILRIAEKVGKIVAEENCILICGGERNGGVIEEAMKGAKKKGGIVVGIVRDKEKASEYADIVIETGGKVGLREYILAINCDLIIVIGGGSGTLNEICVAYQNKIPIFCIKGTGGWADKLEEYLDERKKVKIKKIYVEELKEILKKFKSKDHLYQN